MNRRPRQRIKKRHSDESEEESSDQSDIEMAAEDDEPGTTSPEQEAPVERLGRGARTLAKVRGFLFRSRILFLTLSFIC
jgi:hypothetical protein